MHLQSRSLFLESFSGLRSRVSIKCSPDWPLQLHSSIPCFNYVCVLVLAGSDGSSAGGQPAGRQHHAEDGSTLLLCTLAHLQRQVQYLHRLQQHTLHTRLRCALTHVTACLASLFRFKHPSEGELCALAGKQVPKPNRRDRWELFWEVQTVKWIWPNVGHFKECLNLVKCSRLHNEAQRFYSQVVSGSVHFLSPCDP